MRPSSDPASIAGDPGLVACGARHAAAIQEIFNDAILHSTALYDYAPRPRAAVEAWIEAKRQGNHPLLGIEGNDGALAGFASYGPFRAFPAYKYTVEHSVYVERARRGQGIGKRLLRGLIAAAQGPGQEYHTLVGAIDSANAASVRLHEGLGFERCGRLRQAGFKFGRWLDLDFYQLLLSTPERPADG